MLEWLLEIMQYSYGLEYSPGCWIEANMIFLDKPGKKDKSHKRAYRPITLSSFIIKIFERLFLWDLEQEHFQEKPIHEKQHGYRLGKGCDSALAETLDCIESGYHKQEYVLVLWFDIKGAFDNLNIEQALQAMRNRGVPDKFIRWYRNYLDTRVVYATMHGETQLRRPAKGFPQGGVFSPTFYTISGEGAMKIVNKIKRLAGPGSQIIKEFNKSCNGTGLADDTNAILRGKCLNTLFNKMQQIINALSKWATQFGLTFCPDKTRYVIYTQRKIPPILPQLMLDNHPVLEGDKGKEQKYLGVIIDHKLKFDKHIKHKIQQTKQKLATLKNRITRKHGPNPKWLKYAYEAVAKPTMTYAAHIWAHKLTPKHKAELKKINRLACTIISNQIGNAPTDGLMMMLGIMPLDISIELTAVNTYLNISGTYETYWNSVTNHQTQAGF
jgi:retron-type reverse transcriptase